LRCIGGQMQCRLVVDTDEKRERVAKMGIKDPRKKYQIEDMVRGDCLFAATGITDDRMLQGVRFGNGIVETQTVVMRFGHRHGALDPCRAPAAGEILGLRLFIAPSGQGRCALQQLNIGPLRLFGYRARLKGSQSCVARWSLARSTPR
jgi:hypothetical protein